MWIGNEPNQKALANKINENIVKILSFYDDKELGILEIH